MPTVRFRSPPSRRWVERRTPPPASCVASPPTSAQISAVTPPHPLLTKGEGIQRRIPMQEASYARPAVAGTGPGWASGAGLLTLNGADELVDGHGVDGPGEQEPLAFVAPLELQRGELGSGLDPLGEGLEVQALSQLDERPHQGSGVGPR